MLVFNAFSPSSVHLREESSNRGDAPNSPVRNLASLLIPRSTFCLPSISMSPIRLSILCFLLLATTCAAQQLCNPARSLLDPLTHNFESDCNVTSWCQPTSLPASNLTDTPLLDANGDVVPPEAMGGTCVGRGCRNDEFPFGSVSPDLASRDVEADDDAGTERTRRFRQCVWTTSSVPTKGTNVRTSLRSMGRAS